jgi:hypothetical protein
VTRSIPYNQALRIRRIYSTDKSLKKRLSQLKNHLKRRGYKQSIIKKSFNKAQNISRSSLLQYKEKQECKRTPCVLTYHPLSAKQLQHRSWALDIRRKNSKLSKIFPEPPMVAFKQPNNLRNLLVQAEMLKPNTTIGKSHSCGDKRCKCCKNTRHRIPVRSPENSTTYCVLLIARVQLLFTFLSVPFVASNTLASLSNPSTNAWMDTGVTLQKSYFFLWVSTSDCLTTISRILTEWKSSSLNRTVYGVIFNVRIGKEFGLKNSVFYIGRY